VACRRAFGCWNGGIRLQGKMFIYQALKNHDVDETSGQGFVRS
jgi:hypothetical protein